MARVKISEYRAKRLLLGDSYKGTSFGAQTPKFPKNGTYVVKVDEGVKKRFKQGLVAVNIKADKIPRIAAGWRKKGFTRFIAEPYVPHQPNEERYLSLERVRGGVRVLYSKLGGIDVESAPEKVAEAVIGEDTNIASAAEKLRLPELFLKRLIASFNAHLFAFLEINPLILRENGTHFLDAALLADSTGSYFLSDSWTDADVVEAKKRHPAEEEIERVAKTTPASLKLTVLNPHGSVFLLLSGGGGSIVIADEAQAEGAGNLLGNYGEYSGGPTRAETHLYARQVLNLLLASHAKKKALVIAGGIANFTDVKTTFLGITDALSERAADLKKAKVKVFIRRGGPNEREGLSLMRAFLEEKGLLGSVHGSESIITLAMTEALSYVRS